MSSFIKRKLTLENLKRYLPYLILLMVTFLFYKNVSLSGDDAVYFHDALNGEDIHNIREYIIKRYNTWSSRLLMEPVDIFMTNHLWIWKIVSPLMYVLLLYSINKLFLDNKNENQIMLYVSMLLILLFPQQLFNSAGWCITTILYLYPLSLYMFSLIPIKKIIKNEKIKPYEYVLYLLAYIFAINEEQMLVISILTDLLFLIYQIKTKDKNKNKNKLIFIYFIISIIQFIIVITCPGNHSRVKIETQAYFKNFEKLNMIDKFALGTISTMQHLLYYINEVYIVFNIVITSAILKNKKTSTFAKLMSFLPLMTSILFYVMISLRIINKVMYGCSLSKILRSSAGVMIVIVSILNYIAIIFNVYNALPKNKKIIGIFTIMTGFISRIMLGFSASLYASSTRTYLFLFMAMIIVVIFIMNDDYNKINEKDVNLDNNDIALLSKTEFYYLVLFIFVMAIIATTKNTIYIYNFIKNSSF